MKKLIPLMVLAVAVVVMTGCNSYRFERSGARTVESHPTPDGGQVDTVSYVENGQGSGFEPGPRFQNYYQAPMQYRSYQPVYRQHNNYGGSPVHITPAPSANDVRGLLPQ